MQVQIVPVAWCVDLYASKYMIATKNNRLYQFELLDDHELCKRIPHAFQHILGDLDFSWFRIKEVGSFQFQEHPRPLYLIYSALVPEEIKLLNGFEWKEAVSFIDNCSLNEQCIIKNSINKG